MEKIEVMPENIGESIELRRNLEECGGGTIVYRENGEEFEIHGTVDEIMEIFKSTRMPGATRKFVEARHKKPSPAAQK